LDERSTTLLQDDQAFLLEAIERISDRHDRDTEPCSQLSVRGKPGARRELAVQNPVTQPLVCELASRPKVPIQIPVLRTRLDD
jgi:hypothetical protein